MRRIPFVTGWETRRHASFFFELVGAATPWQPTDLPHDATLSEPRNPQQRAVSGYFPGGVYEYRKTFAAPEEWRDCVALEFEGVYRSAMIYVNDDLAGRWPTGYTGFVVPLDTFLRYGKDNEVRVVCRSHADSRWYAGAGIHRPVHLVVGAITHVALDGVRVTTVDADADQAVVEIATTAQNDGRGLAQRSLITEVRDRDGNVASTATSPVTVPPDEPAVVRQRLLVRNPALWSTDSPALYTASVVLRDGDDVVDDTDVTFGIRTLSLDPERDLRINGESTLLRGACVHFDNGVLGAATIARSDERRVERLKAAGFNALRSAHNPMSGAMLDACDRLGVLVMDELSDIWTESKTDFDAALDFPGWWECEVEAMVRKDANHPSVVLYSIGSEIPEVARPHGAMWSRRLAEKVRSLDSTRYVTNGVNAMLAVLREAMSPEAVEGGINTLLANMGEFMDELAGSELVAERTAEAYDVLDLAGMNYMDARYEVDRELFPRRVIVGSETSPPRIDRLWRLVQDNSHVVGDFTWTGWDYLGEAGVGRVAFADDPTAGEFGAPLPMAAGARRRHRHHRAPAARVVYREIVFGLRHDPYIAVQRPERHGRELVSTPWAWTDSVGSWTFPGAERTPVTVEVCSDAEEVELLLDGRSVGLAPAGEKHRFRAEFEVTYEPGELTAVARTSGEVTGRCTLRTAVGPVRLAAVADRCHSGQRHRPGVCRSLAAGRRRHRVPGNGPGGHVVVDGAGALAGFGSAAPATEESYTDDVHTTFDGRALAVIRPTGAGTITVMATAPGCEAASVTVVAQ